MSIIKGKETSGIGAVTSLLRRVSKASCVSLVHWSLHVRPFSVKRCGGFASEAKSLINRL
jgi:hypothetical protein